MPDDTHPPLLSLLRRFLQRPRRDQWLFVRVYILLGLARLAINCIPFSTLAKHLGTPSVESPTQIPPPHFQEAQRIAWAVSSASRYTPWKSNCFPQAIAAKYLLQRRGIASTLYLGAAFKQRTELEAHAWLKCGGYYVTGGKGHDHFGTVGIFG
jgi:Transglutaminase-like superfamily